MPAKTTAANGVKPALLADSLDLDALLAERRLDPVPVKLGGHTYSVRRDLTATEIDAFETSLKQGKEGDQAAFGILLGQDDAARFLELSAGLPREHEVLVTQKIVVAAKLRTADQFGWADQDGGSGEQGESGAS